MGEIINIKKDKIIDQILSIEWEMFKNVKTAVPAECQKNPGAFREIRKSIFETWTEEMLNSYKEDLIKAKEAGRNLFVEKYARMDNLLPPLKFNPLIDKIVEIEEKWQKEIEEKYPALFYTVCRNTSGAPDDRDFSLYLKSELETYGNKTIKLYYEHVRQASEKGENLAIKSLESLVKKSGFSSLEHAEVMLRNSINR